MTTTHRTTADAPAAVRETHSGVVVLVGDRAYKLKKPVNLGFLDFSTRERRAEACRRETRLNRRLSPDVYLGVATVADPEGRPCESLVVMRRMPDDRRLSTLVASGAEVTTPLRRLARDLAAFHATARTGREISEAGSPDRLLARWSANVDDLRRRGLPSERADLVWREAEAYVEGRHELLASRMAAGLVRDGHGDLLADDIFCLDDGPRALDCLDFDDRLRWMDVLDDVACLAMDLERLGAPAAAARFVADYGEFSGRRQPETLVDHYIAYRAVMRAKIAALRRDQLDQTGSPPAEDVDRLVGLGLAHLARAQVRMLLVGGPPGTGKTTLAGAVADAVGGVLLSSDRLRKEVLGLDPTRRHPAPYGSGIYTAEATERTYRYLAERAGEVLSRGELVVADASFSTRAHRALLREVAERTRTRLVEVRCRPPRAVAEARLRARAELPDRYSDAGPMVGGRLDHDSEPWPEAEVVDTSADLRACVDQVRHRWDPDWSRRDRRG
jgi:aminoglycoside phosphotransferase family enzyme/predicted kinase